MCMNNGLKWSNVVVNCIYLFVWSRQHRKKLRKKITKKHEMCLVFLRFSSILGKVIFVFRVRNFINVPIYRYKGCTESIVTFNALVWALILWILGCVVKTYSASRITQFLSITETVIRKSPVLSVYTTY